MRWPRLYMKIAMRFAGAVRYAKNVGLCHKNACVRSFWIKENIHEY